MNHIIDVNNSDLDAITESSGPRSSSNEVENHTSSSASTLMGGGYESASLIILNKYKKTLLFNTLNIYFSIDFIVLLFLFYNIYRYFGVL